MLDFLYLFKYNYNCQEGKGTQDKSDGNDFIKRERHKLR